MSIGAISGLTEVGLVHPDHVSVPAPGPAATAAPAQPLASGSSNLLSPAVLAALVGEQVALYGSFSGG